MKTLFSASLFIGMLGFTSAVMAQNINLSYTHPNALFVCSSDTFFIDISHTSNAPLAGAGLSMNFPAGLQYAIASVSGASEQNVSNLSSPQFGLPDIAVGQVLRVSLLVDATCAAADILDNGQLFIANLMVNSSLGNVQVNTTSIPLETGAIVIESITEQFLSGELNDTLLRRVCVKNTRLGSIGALFFEDSHPAGIEVWVDGALNPFSNTTQYAAELPNTIFQTVGNGNLWLETQESVCFNEKIVITSCGTPTFVNASLLRVGWGCGGELCRYDSAVAQVEITPSNKNPLLNYTPIWAPFRDYCANSPVTRGLTIHNEGTFRAQSISVSIEMTDGFMRSGIVPNSVRIVLADGTVLPISASSSSIFLLENCNRTIWNNASAQIPLIDVGENVELLFDVVACVPVCEQVATSFRANFFYKKRCPVDGFISEFALLLTPNEYAVGSQLSAEIGECLADSTTYPFVYHAVSKYLLEDGFWQTQLKLPLGITIDTSCLVFLGGVSPSLFEISQSLDGRQLVSLAWATPLSSDSLTMNFCLQYHCDTTVVCSAPLPDPTNQTVYSEKCCITKIKEDTYWSETLQTDTLCAIHHCAEYVLNVDLNCVNSNTASGDSVGINGDTVIYGLRQMWDAYRFNTGWQDLNDDRAADLPLTSAFDGIRRDRFLSGDTLRVHYVGVVDSLTFIRAIGRAIWLEAVASDMFTNGNDSFLINNAVNSFADSSSFRFLHLNIRLRYADGTEVFCDAASSLIRSNRNFFKIVLPNAFPEEPIDALASQNLFFTFSMSDLCGARPFLEQGDSIIIDTDFKLDFNFTPTSSNEPDPPLIGFRVASDNGGEDFAWNNRPFIPFHYSGWKRSISPNTHNIRPCESSAEVKKFRYSMRIARENMFPFEVRPLAKIADYRQTLPVGITAQSCLLEYLTLQDSVIKITNMALPFTSNPGSLQVDYSSVFSELLDEGFTLRSKLLFNPACQVPLPDASVQYISTIFENCLNGSINEATDSILNTIGFFSSVPKVVLLSSDTSVLSPSRNFEISFILKNLVVGNAPAPWVALYSPSGLFSGINLFQMPQNQVLNSTNGLYHLNNLQSLSQQSFRITGQNTSCKTDSLAIIFGWDCSPLSSLSEPSCFRDTFWIKFVLQLPELELDVLLEPNPLSICDTSTYFEYEIYNAQNGYAYDLKSSIKLPQGLFFAPGTAQFSYPAGSPWVNIPDPLLLTSQLYQWDVNAFSALLATNGLLGVSMSPQNTLRIRFKTIVQCGFVANTPIIYGVSGVEACGKQTNILNKPGGPLRVEGLDVPYNVQVNLSAQGSSNLTCGDELTLSFQLNLMGNTSPQDSFYVLLPEGVSYVSGSYSPGLNAPPGPVTLNAQGFQIPLPGTGNTVQGTFRVLIGPGAGCLDRIFTAQTRFQSVIFCPILGTSCEVYVATGEDTWIFSPQHPALQPSNVSFAIENGVLSGELTLTNVGNATAQGALIEWWRDVDGNGVYSAADVLIKTFTSATLLAPGASIVLQDILNQLDSNDLCGIILRIPADANCACNSPEILLNELNLQHSAIFICDIQPLSVGVPTQNGFSYTWQPVNGLNCTTCSVSQYTPDDVASQLLTLMESSANCTITHTFLVNVGAVGEIIASDTVICTGNSVILSVSPQASTYEWQGPGIQNFNAASQTVQPGSSSTYYVNVSFSNGCTASDTLYLSVLATDTIYLSGLTTCVGDSVLVLGVLRATSGTYQVISPKMNGCDSVLIQSLAVIPAPNTQEERRFCLGDSLLVFDSIFVESGTICRLYSAISGCDSTHCVVVLAQNPPTFAVQDTIRGAFGELITLTGPGGFVTYLWEPDPTPPCVNCPSVTYPLDTTGFQEYRLRLQDTSGCSGELTFRVVIFPPCSADSLYIPNAFTPNGDGANDVFRVVASEGGEVVSSLEIYNRWGQKVYENRMDSVWDGRINGEPASSDVYVYIVTVTCGDLVGKRVGDVTLLR